MKEFRKTLEIKAEEVEPEKKFKKAMILLDDASSHKTVALKSWAVETGVVLVFNVPYFSKANPVKLFFSELKNRCKTINARNH